MAGILDFLWTHVLSVLLVLGLVITIHELGHFLVAKWLDTAIDRFSIGFGRALLSWKDRSGVEWRVGWIPLGGYVKFAGDENAASIPDQDELDALRREVIRREGPAAMARYFHFKPTWQRTLIVAAGPVANFLLAIALFASLFMAFGRETVAPRIGQVDHGSAAEAAGFRAGDLIVAADKTAIGGFDDLERVIQVRAGVPIDFTLQRGAARIHLSATPRLQTRNDPIAGTQQIGVLGIRSSADPKDLVRVRYGPLQAVGAGAQRTWEIVTTTVYYLGRMITGHMSAANLSGPIGIASVTSKVAALGAVGAHSLPDLLIGVGAGLLQLAALISVSLGFMNLLPLPVLDGGHLLFYAYEAVARRPLAAKVQAAGYRVGLALVLGLMLFATWNDLQRLRVLNFLGGFFS